MRARRAQYFYIFSPVRMELLFHGGSPMNSTHLPSIGFANRRNRLLRSRIVRALNIQGQLSAFDLARIAYESPRRASRGGRPSTPAQLVATRRALRRLAAKGRIVTIGRYRRRKLYVLKQCAEEWRAISLGSFNG